MNKLIHWLLLSLLVGNAFAQSYTFYFLPPPEDEWILGSLYLKEEGNDEPIKFTASDSRCGWYRLTFSGSVPDANAWIWLNGNKKGGPDDRIGDKGLGEDPTEWKNGNPVPFNLANRFDEAGGRELYFVAEEGTDGWKNSYPGDGADKRCRYDFAAIIYHTNTKKNSSFSAWSQNQADSYVEGLVRGIVQPTLDANGKMQFNNSQGTDWTEPNFVNAFKSTPGVNVQRCFDMPFTRRGDLWEFDALRLCGDGSADYTGNCNGHGGTIGGFFPPALMEDVDVKENIDYTKEYEAMGGRETYRGSAGVGPRDCVNKWCFDRGWYGGTCTSNGRSIPADNRHSEAGDLSWVNSNTSKEDIDDYMRTICWEPFRQSGTDNGNPMVTANGINLRKGDFYNGNGTIPLQGGGQTSGNITSLMCFESAPATFIYEEGQEFFFRGDDDVWVFINNQLVVDLGGNHEPVPGYVKLDTIKSPEKLTPGREYPIKIFFCDRRRTGSNVLISTNMYFAQQTGIFVKGDAKTGHADICLHQQGGGGSCSAVADGSTQTSQELCGNEVNGKIGFYIINRKGDDARTLDIDDQNCKPDGDQKFVCYGGITVDMSNGTAKVQQDKVVGLPGTWYLYARSLDPKVVAEDVKIATITTATSVRMAWGSIKDGSVNGTTITDICKNPAVAATGELVPVCFSGGDFTSDNVFLIDDIDAIGGSLFKLDTKGFAVDGNRLKIFFDSLGTSPVRTDTTLTIPGGSGGAARPSSGSKPGVLVLWVTGDYVQEQDTVYYSVNVNSRPATEEVTIKSVIPKLQWVRASGSEVAIPANQQKGSKWKTAGDPTSDVVRDDNNHPAPVWVGELIKLNLRAHRDGKTCKTCTYDLTLTADAKAGTSVLSEKNGNLIVSSGLRIVNGEASLEIAGKKNVEHPYYASIIVRGISSRSDVKWDSLAFQEPPVPFPETTRIFDVNGDGIGDSIVIAYNRGFRADSLPNVIEVQWDKDTTIVYGLGKRSVSTNGKDTVYSNKGIVNDSNVQYWTRYLKNITPVTAAGLEARKTMTSEAIKALRDTIILKRGPTKNEDSVHFSRSVLTKSETGKIANWASFETGEGTLKKMNDISLASNIEDKIPAIIISARYLADDVNKGCGGSPNSSCRDKVTLEFSEPVKIDPGASGLPPDAPELRNAFAYMLRDIGKDNWDVLGAAFISPSMRYNKSGIERPSEDGNDSIVSMFFNRYREGDNKSGTPMPGDSVKFASLGKYAGFAKNILVDVKGNPPNPKEKGRQIEGRKPFTPEKIPIGEIDPNYPDYVKDITDVLDRNGSYGYDKDSLFSKSRPIELLPVPPDWTIKDILREYPGTIGILFNPDVFNELADLEDLYGPISDGDITIYPKVFYHTNLGNYVADRGFSVKCNDPIFPRNDKGQPSCRDSRSKFYIAWDMRDFKGRVVGAGAYVGLYDFRWEIFIQKENRAEVKEKIERKVEMHGVKRVKKK